MKKYDLALLACSAAKAITVVGQKLPARLLYVGPTFRMALELAEREAGEVRILSALHHVLRPDDNVAFYDHRLPTSKREHQRWSDTCRLALNNDPYLVNRERSLKVLILAPKAYAAVRHDQHLVSEWDWTWPLQGLGIGQQKSWLKRALAGEVVLP